MKSSALASTPVALINPPQSRRQKAVKYCFYFSQVAITGLSIAAALSQATYAMSFAWGGKDADPQQVNPDWFFNELSNSQKVLAVYNGASTLALGSVFGYRFTNLSAKLLVSEFSLLRQGLITKKRFFTETTAALCAALTGGMLQGMPFQGIVQWGARFLGFVMVGGMSIIGMNSLIIKFTDKNFKFKQLVLEYLKQRLSPESLAEANKLLNGPLNIHNLKEFLTKFFAAAEAYEVQQELEFDTQQQALESQLQKIEAKQSKFTPFFREPSRIGETINSVIAGVLTVPCTCIYGEGAYQGLNLFLGGSLTNIPTIAKGILGVAIGSPLSLFVFFNFKIFNSALNDLLLDEKDPKRFAKAAVLLFLGLGASTWYNGLSRSTVTNSVIFSSLLNTQFGGIPFQSLAQAASCDVGVEGTVPLFTALPDLKNPMIKDAIKFAQAIPPEKLIDDALVSHSFFRKNHQALVDGVTKEREKGSQLQEEKKAGRDQPTAVIAELQTAVSKPVSSVIIHVGPEFEAEEIFTNTLRMGASSH